MPIAETAGNLQPVDTVSDVGPETFARHYGGPQKPLLIRDLARKWPACEKWDLEYMREWFGDTLVPLHRTGSLDPRASFNAPQATMRFNDYVDLLLAGPTDWRIFLLNPLKLTPSLQKDFLSPPILRRFSRRYPMLFFGGQQARVFLHFDIDMSHVFHTHFGGRKRVVLFPPSESTALYQLPFSVRSFMDVDAEKPDYRRFPALALARGYRVDLSHGDTLYIPPGWWHQLRYVDVGFSLSQRALNEHPLAWLQALGNVTLAGPVESIARAAAGQRWHDWKAAVAIARAERLIRGNG